MREWLQTRGRGLLSLLSDVGGALAFVVAAIALVVAALTGTVLLLLDAFPQPFFTMLVLAMALLAAGLALHLLRGRLAPPPSTSAPLPSAAQSSNPYSQAAALQRRRDQAKVAAEDRDRLLKERRAIRRVREELLDNMHVLARIPGDQSELLSLRFHAWSSQETTLLELDDPAPHLDASAAYRELYGLCRGRVGDDEMGGQYTYGDRPNRAEIAAVEVAIEKATATLLQAAGDGQLPG
jgi:hypothetical protein